MPILENLKNKQNDLKKINRDIVELLSEDKLGNKVIQSDDINMNITLGTQKISKELKSKKLKNKESQSNTTVVKVSKYYEEERKLLEERVDFCSHKHIIKINKTK